MSDDQTVNVTLTIAQLKKLLEVLQEDDEGPYGEGWPSQGLWELRLLFAEVMESLK